ncbi:MAG TPA: hypothetical protein VHB54_01750 [Mucilaginibacter sp.]|nr:hypothetical protein [Mucilaginibacter sp.]
MKKFLFFWLIVVVCSCSIKKSQTITNSTKTVTKTTTTVTNTAVDPVYQNNTYTYVHDFSNPAPDQENIQKVRHMKDRVFIRIINLNRLSYGIRINGRNVTITSDNTSIFDSLAKSLNTSKISMTPGSTIKQPTPATGKPAKSAIAGKKTPSGPDVVTPAYAKIINNEKDINSALETMKNDMSTLQYFLNFSAAVPYYITSEKYSQDTLEAQILRDINLKQFDPSIKTFGNLMSSISSKPVNEANQVKDSYTNITALIKKNDSLINVLTGLCSSPNKSDTGNVCTILLPNAKNGLAKGLNDGLGQASKVSIDSIAKAVRILDNLLVQVNDKNSFTYYSPAFYPQGDYLQIGVKIKPKNASIPSLYVDTLSYNIPVKGQFEWAIGPALNFGFGSGSFDRSFQIDSARNSNGTARKNDMFTIKQNGSNKMLLPSIGVMAAFYWQTHDPVTPGISVGVSTAPTDLSTLRAYLGGSLLVGGFETDNKNNLIYNRLIISLGFAYGQVDRLKENLKIGDNPKSQVPFNGNTVATDQLTEKVGRVGFFFGITYKIN